VPSPAHPSFPQRCACLLALWKILIFHLVMKFARDEEPKRCPTLLGAVHAFLFQFAFVNNECESNAGGQRRDGAAYRRLREPCTATGSSCKSICLAAAKSSRVCCEDKTVRLFVCESGAKINYVIAREQGVRVRRRTRTHTLKRRKIDYTPRVV
jgi:hypothetical protein